MKAKHYINLLIVLTLVLNACKKNGNNADNPKPTIQKYLIKLVTVNNTPGIGLITTTTDYTYDSKKRKATQKSGNVTTNYAYYDDGKLFSSTQLFNEGDDLKIYTEYAYTGTLISRETETVYKNNQDFADYITDYVYNGNLLTEVHADAGYVDLYTYDSHNDAVKVEDTRGNITTTTVYTYDSNHRKLTETITGGNPQVPNAYAYTYDSHNNVTKVVTTTGATITTANTTYFYDADGYITGYTADDGGHGTYTYSTLN